MKWRGSYTVEAAVIIPVLIWTMAAAMCTGIDCCMKYVRSMKKNR